MAIWMKTCGGTLKNWLKTWLAPGLLAVAVIWAGGPAVAQPAKTIDEVVNVVELKRLLDVARESGFSEEEVRKITVEFNGKVLNVWEFLNELERKRAEKIARDKAMREKPYYTVQDVFADLEKGQSGDLEILRKDFRFNQ